MKNLNSSLASKYNEDGYLLIKNFFTKNEIGSFLKACDNDFYIKEINMSPEITSNKILKKIFYNKKFLSLIAEISDNKASYFGCGSVVGHIENNRITWRRLHTDTRGHDSNINGRTYYDPAKKNWPVFDVYIYLEDFQNNSGCLKVIKGSHRKFLPTIGNFIKVLFNISKDYKFDGKYSIKSVPIMNLFNMRNLKTVPGDLVIFNHAIHHSPNSLILKLFPNLVLPVFIENFIEKYFKKIYKPISKKRRIISIPFGINSIETKNFIRSRIQYCSKKFIEKNDFFINKNFRKNLEESAISCDLSLSTYLKEKKR